MSIFFSKLDAMEEIPTSSEGRSSKCRPIYTCALQWQLNIASELLSPWSTRNTISVFARFTATVATLSTIPFLQLASSWKPQLTLDSMVADPFWSAICLFPGKRLWHDSVRFWFLFGSSSGFAAKGKQSRMQRSKLTEAARRFCSL